MAWFGMRRIKRLTRDTVRKLIPSSSTWKKRPLLVNYLTLMYKPLVAQKKVIRRNRPPKVSLASLHTVENNMSPEKSDGPALCPEEALISTMDLNATVD